MLSNIWNDISTVFINLFTKPDLRDFFDILIVTFVVYQAFKLVRQTRANSLLKGLAVVFLSTWISEKLQLSAVNWMLHQAINAGAILLVVLFQPELRRALEKIGRSNFWRNIVPGSRQEVTEESITQELAQALINMSRKKIGALIVIEGRTGLQDIIDSGTIVDAVISAPLIENIFEPNTPLHDGAMIISGPRIIAAACLLQLSEDHGISRELGTRHRAALGMSETTDAVVFIVSEETGIISVAKEGKLTRHLDREAIINNLNDLYDTRSTISKIPVLFGRKGGSSK